MSSFREPLHKQLERILKKRIGTIWLPGSRIPTEIELAKEFQVALQTVRRTLGDLVREGLLVRRRGSGSYVCDVLPRKPVGLLCDWDLSTKPDPHPELLLIRHCQQSLLSAGIPYKLYFGFATYCRQATQLTCKPFLHDWREEVLGAVVYFSPVLVTTTQSAGFSAIPWIDCVAAHQNVNEWSDRTAGVFVRKLLQQLPTENGSA